RRPDDWAASIPFAFVGRLVVAEPDEVRVTKALEVRFGDEAEVLDFDYPADVRFGIGADGVTSRVVHPAAEPTGLEDAVAILGELNSADGIGVLTLAGLEPDDDGVERVLDLDLEEVARPLGL